MSDAKRRELELAAAVAREEAVQFHVNSALGFIGLGTDRVQPERMLDIYLRLHGMSGAHGELLAYRVLAALGQGAPTEPPHFPETEPEPPTSPTSLLGTVRNRLRGRVHHELRRWIELATGATQAGLLQLHVRHAIRFARDLAETHTVAQASALYANMAGVPAALEDSLYIFLVDRLAAEELPKRNAPQVPAGHGVTLHPPRSSRHRRAG
jgi:hypothetical protein